MRANQDEVQPGIKLLARPIRFCELLEKIVLYR